MLPNGCTPYSRRELIVFLCTGGNELPGSFKAIYLFIYLLVRPDADQSSKAAFGKSAFAKTCFLLLKIRHGAHQCSKNQKCFRARFGMF